MKKSKHILINVTEPQYNELIDIAEKQERKLSNLCYLIIKEYLNKAKDN